MTKPKPPRQVQCIDCGDFAGWIEGRGRPRLRCYPCYTVHLRAYNAAAKRKERFGVKVDRVDQVVRANTNVTSMETIS